MTSIFILFEKIFISIFDLLPKNLEFRSKYVFLLTLPLIILKIAKGTFFIERLKNQKRISANNITKKINPDDYHISDLPVIKSNERLCIRYSGGADSTVAAAKMTEHFSKICLLTFDNTYKVFSFGLIKSDPLNSRFNAEILKRQFSKCEFTHEIRKTEELKNSIYFKYYQPKFTEKNFLRVLLCPACTMASHIETIIFCLNNSIKFITDGANIETGILPWQTQYAGNLYFIKNFYAQFDLNYIINPGYLNMQTDEELTNLDLIDKKYNRSYYPYRRLTQQFCIPIHLQSLCLKLHRNPMTTISKHATINNGIFHVFQENIGEFKNYIESKISN